MCLMLLIGSSPLGRRRCKPLYSSRNFGLLELHGKGRFFDPRLNNAAQFPIAAAHNLGDLPHIDPDDDLITKKLPALQFYQLAIPAPTPQPSQDFDPAAAKRGDDLFSGKAKCNNCHVDPLWTEPGWNLHTPA